MDGDAVNGHPEIDEGRKERFEEGTKRPGWKHAALVLPTGWTDEYLGHQDKLGHGATDTSLDEENWGTGAAQDQKKS